MIAVVFANEEEANPFLKQYQQGRFSGLHEGDTVQDNQIIVTVTGPGKIKSTLRTERLLQSDRVKRLIHPGTCLALNEKIGLGSILAVNQVYEGDRVELSAPTYPRMPLESLFPQYASATLVTQDHSLTQESEQSYWQRIADLSDNTSYAIAYVAATHGIPCNIVKVVTNILSQQTPSKDQENPTELEKQAQALTSVLKDLAQAG